FPTNSPSAGESCSNRSRSCPTGGCSTSKWIPGRSRGNTASPRSPSTPPRPPPTRRSPASPKRRPRGSGTGSRSGRKACWPGCDGAGHDYPAPGGGPAGLPHHTRAQRMEGGDGARRLRRLAGPGHRHGREPSPADRRHDLPGGRVPLRPREPHLQLLRLASPQLRFRRRIPFRSQRHVRLDRIQSVDLNRPLLARVFGFVSLQVTSAGSGQDNLVIAYVRDDEAGRLRNEILARAAGLGSGEEQAPAPEAPERELLRITPGRIAGSLIRSLWFLFGIALTVGLIA